MVKVNVEVGRTAVRVEVVGPTTCAACAECVFRAIVTARFGNVTAEFGNVTGRFGDVTGGDFALA